MKKLFGATAALALMMSCGNVVAQITDSGPTPPPVGQPNSATPEEAKPSDAKPSDAKPGSYWGVDTDRKRVDVQAPAGGNDRAQADANEEPITRRLNEQALKNANPGQ